MTTLPKFPFKKPISYLDLTAQYLSLKEDIDAGIARVIKNCSFILGEETQKFETEFAQFCGVKHALGCSNGTDALTLALDALDIGPGHEVMTTPFTFVSTVETALKRGASVIFADISPEDFNIDPVDIEKRLTKKTKALIPVHLYGQPARMPEICEIAKNHNLKVIEDSAQAHGAKIGGQPIATFGDIGTFSFYPGKNLGAYGDAGAVVTQNAALHEKLKLLRDHGRKDKYTYQMVGYNARMDGMQAAILRAKLPHLAKWNAARQSIADIYREELKGANNLVLPQKFPKALGVAHLFVVRHPRRDELQKRLADAGVPSLVHYPLGLHVQPGFGFLGYKPGDFPHTEKAAAEVLSLPCYPELSHEEVRYIAECLREICKQI